MIDFNRNLFPDSEPDAPSGDYGDIEDMEARIAMLEEQVDILHGTNLKLRAVLAATTAVLGAVEQYARIQRRTLAEVVDQFDVDGDCG